MKTNCNSCNCFDNGLTTTHDCVNSYPECRESNPCSEIISDLCVIHNPNGMLITYSNQNFIVPQNIPLHSFMQLLGMMLDPNLAVYAATTNQYGPILGLRTVFVGQNIFKLRWDFPNVPDPNVMPTVFKVIVREYGTSNLASYKVDSSVNMLTVYNSGTIIYAPNKTYLVQVQLVDSNNLTIVLTSSATIIVNT